MQKYSFQDSEEGTAKAYGRKMSISTKDSINICKAIRGKPVGKAKKILQAAVDMERPIRYGRFTDGVGHKPGIGPGRFPIKAATGILKVVNSAEANAQNKGLGSNLVIIHATAHLASRGYRYGRQRRRKEKATHVEIVVKESEIKKKEKSSVKEVETKEEPKLEVQKDVPVVEEKVEVQEPKTEKEPKTKAKPAKKEIPVKEPETKEKTSKPKKEAKPVEVKKDGKKKANVPKESKEESQ